MAIELWYYTNEGKQMDAVTMKELKRLVNDGSLKPTDMVWKDGMARWIRASSLTELFPDPMSPLDKYFTHTREAEKKDPSKTGVTAPPGSTSNNTTPGGDTQQKRKPKGDGDDEGRPPRRRQEASGAGSNVGTFMAPRCAVIVLVGGLLGSVALLVILFKPAAEEKKPATEEQGKKIEGGVGKPLEGEEEYKAPIKPRETHKSKLWTLKGGTEYRFHVKGAQGPIDLFVRTGDDNQVARFELKKFPVVMDWKPTQDGDYRLALENMTDRDVTAIVTIKEKGAVPKTEPLPKDTLEGKNSFTTAFIDPKGVIERKFRVKAGYAASFNVSPIANKASKGTPNFDIQVVKDSDRNAEVAADTKPDANAKVSFTLQAQEIVVVRIINAGPTRNKVSVIYDVSP